VQAARIAAGKPAALLGWLFGTPLLFREDVIDALLSLRDRLFLSRSQGA
jgi:hypothetical protein